MFPERTASHYVRDFEDGNVFWTIMRKPQKDTIVHPYRNAAIRFCLLYLVYVLFVSTLDSTELIAGLVAALVATVAASICNIPSGLRACPTLGDTAQCWRIPWYALKGATQLLRVLSLHLLRIKPAASELKAVRYISSPDACRATARRALASLFTTMTPNSIVLGFTRDHQFFLVHQIKAGELPPIARRLGARP